MELKETVESFVYPHLKKLARLMREGGKDAQWMGIPCLGDKENFTGGTLMLAAGHLLAYQLEREPEEAEQTLRDWLMFASWAAEKPMGTWGKLSAVRALWNVKKAGKWDALSPELLEKLKKRTEYDDFFDSKTMELKDYATNYLHVAMAVAGYRAKLGFEAPGMAEKIFDLFLKRIREASPGGWMDDSDGFGRFDRYSFLIYAELADTCHALGLPIPAQVEDGVKKSVELLMSLCSARGDGVAYGRSLSAHGDLAVPEVISAAAREGWLREDQKARAIDCCRACLSKALTFWFNKELGAFDLWFGGRTTNRYRRVHRNMQVNLDLCDHLVCTLENLEAGGLANIDMTPVPAPRQEGVSVRRTDFVRPKNALYVVKTPRRLYQLPVSGTGTNYRYPAYYPLPVTPRFLELPPENPSDGSALPLFLPMAELADGCAALPIQHYAQSVSREMADGAEVVISLDALTLVGGREPQPLEGSGAQLRYWFGTDGTVRAKFEFTSEKTPIRALRMLWMSQTKLLAQSANRLEFEDGAVELPGWTLASAQDAAENEDFFTPHGAGLWTVSCTKQADGATCAAAWELHEA